MFAHKVLAMIILSQFGDGWSGYAPNVMVPGKFFLDFLLKKIFFNFMYMVFCLQVYRYMYMQCLLRPEEGIRLWNRIGYEC